MTDYPKHQTPDESNVAFMARMLAEFEEVTAEAGGSVEVVNPNRKAWEYADEITAAEVSHDNDIEREPGEEEVIFVEDDIPTLNERDGQIERDPGLFGDVPDPEDL